jgi:TonB family protein
VKRATFMAAFFVSTAIHVGALSSNLLHVSAGSVPENRVQAVRLHIVPPAVTAPPIQPQDPMENVLPEIPSAAGSEVIERNMSEQFQDMRHDTPAAETSRVDAVEKESLPEKSTVPEIEKKLREEVTSSDESPQEYLGTYYPVVPGGPNQGSIARAYPSSLTGLAPVPVKRSEGKGSRESKRAVPAMITLSSKPNYPRYSRLHKEEGTTVLSVEILSDGQLGRVDVVRSSGYRRLDQAAVKGMQNAELIPALKDGKKVTSIKRIAIKFDLEDWGE